MFDPPLDLDFGGILAFMEQVINAFSDFLYTIFRFGNYILFVIFVVMGIVLYLNAREIEYREEIHGKIEAQKKRGRAGSVLCIFIAFGFLFKIITIFLYDLYNLFPEPELIIRYDSGRFFTIDSLENTHTLPTFDRVFYFFVSLLSLTSILSIAFGVYLMLFNKFILRSRLKFFEFLIVGLVFWVIFGFKASLKLLI
jgi:hypothetical protein